jgi:hypothetical protein
VRAVRRQVEQGLRRRLARDELEHAVGVRPLSHRGAEVLGQATGRLVELRQAVRERRPVAELQHELAPRGAERLVHAREHPAQAVRAVRRKQSQALRLLGLAERGERLVERLPAEHGGLRLVELAESGVEAGLERVGLEQPVAEAVDRRDPRAVELAGEVVPSAFAQRRADAPAQLARRALRVRDHEHGVDGDAAVADGTHEALDEDGRLSGPGSGRHEDPSRGLDRCSLLRVQARSTRHMGHRSHQVGQSPPFGSCRTSPSRIRPARRRAVSCAPSTWAQKSSSPR